MYADDTTFFNSTNRPKVNSQQRQQLCDALNQDLQTISEWGSQLLVAFNSFKTQSVLHSRFKDDDAPFSLQMSNSSLHEKDTISLLGLTVSSNLSWKSYIQNISKKAAQRIGSLYWESHYLPRESILYLYKATIRPLMEYCCYLWARSLTSFFHCLSDSDDVASLSLFYRLYYLSKCSSALSEGVPKPKVFSRSTRTANPLMCYHVNIERTRTQGRSHSFFVRTGRLWNQFPSACFPNQYDLN